MSLLLDDVSIVVTPNGYKAGTLYGVLPTYAEGAEELNNTDFATETVWTFTNVDFSVGAVLFDSVSDNIFQNWTDTVNTTYKLTITKTGAGTLRFRSGYTGSAATIIDIPESGIIYFTSTSGTSRIQIYGDSGSVNATLNSVSVKEVTSSDMDVTRATAATRVDENGLVNYAVASDLVTNGDFATDSDWAEGAGWDINTTTNVAERSGETGNSAMSQSISLVNGKLYKFSYTRNYISGNGVTNIYSKLDNVSYSTFGTYTSTVVEEHTVTGTFVAGFTGSMSLNVYGIGTFTGNFDNISVKELTNVPRIDYTGGGCPHILAEPQRTNTVTYSEDFSQYSSSGTTPTLTTGQLAPDGTLGATKISGAIGSSVLWLPSVTSPTDVRSIYARTVSGTGTARLLSYYGNTNNTFNLTEEWQRFELTSVTTTSGESNFYIDLRGSQTLSEFIVWGGQCEVGSYPTSYIPTSGSTVTRNQDVFTRDGIGSLINSEEGVLFLEMAALTSLVPLNNWITISDGTASNQVAIGFETNEYTTARVDVGGSNEAYISVSGDYSQNRKIAFKWKSNDFALWIDGVEVGTDVSGSTIGAGTLNSLQFTWGAGGNYTNGKVKQLQVYNTALTDEQLLQLTGESGTDFYESYAEMAAALTYTIQ